MPDHYDPDSFEEGGYPLFEESNPWGKDKELPEDPKDDLQSNSNGFPLFFFGLVLSGLIFAGASAFLKDSLALSKEINCLIAFLSLFFGFGITAMVIGVLNDE